MKATTKSGMIKFMQQKEEKLWDDVLLYQMHFEKDSQLVQTARTRWATIKELMDELEIPTLLSLKIAKHNQGTL